MPKQKKRSGARKRTKKIAVRLRGKKVQVQLPADATPRDHAEAAAMVETLDRSGQIAYGKSLPPGTTHQIEKDSKGNDILVRKRFSAM